MTALTEKYDSALLGILQNEGQVANFMDVVYGFLYRKTDFYHILNEKEKVGFPPGFAQKIALSTFKKYENLARQRNERIQQIQAQKQKGMTAQSKAAKKKERKESEGDKTKDANGKGTAKNAHSDPAEVKVDKPDQVISGKEEKSESERQKSSETIEKTPKKPKNEDEEDGDSELAEMQKMFQANSASYNGAMRDNYSWSQSISEVDVQVTIPSNIRKGSNVEVLIEKKKLRVQYKDTNGEHVMLVDGALCWDIQKEESMWTLTPGEHVLINLEKIQERWWDALLENEPKISVRKIDASRPITDLDEEAQAKIDEMRFNEHQKRLGKPQTHEMKVHDMLKQAWDAEGSPFKGQPFDPSLVTVANQGQLGSDIKLPPPPSS